MAFDPENPHKWFTAGEAASIAAACRVPGVPWTRVGMTKLLKRHRIQDPDEADMMSRKRLGQKGGGGSEFYWVEFPEALWGELDAEVARREAAAMVARSEPAGGMFTPEDEQLMRDAASDLYGPISHFECVGVRRVRRAFVTVRSIRYRLWGLGDWEGQNVLVVLSPAAPAAFIWECCPGTRQLAQHGENGFVGMTMKGSWWLPSPSRLTDWERIIS